MVESVVSFGIASIFIALGSFVLSKHPKAPSNRSFAFTCSWVTVWILANFWESEQIPHHWAEFLLRLDFATAVISATAFLFFSLNFPKPLAFSSSVKKWFLFPTAVFAGLSFSKLIVSNAGEYRAGVQLQFERGPLFWLYALYVVIVLLATYFILVKRWRCSAGADRNRIAYVFFGVLSATAITALVNLYIAQKIVLPALVSRIGVYGVGGLLLTGSIAVAIVRHQLMDIEVLIRKSVVFAGLSTFIFGMVVLPTLALPAILGNRFNIDRWLLTLPAAMIVVILYDPLNRFLVNITDRYLFQKKYDYKQFLKKFTNEALAGSDLRNLADTTVSTVADTIRLDDCSLLLPNRFSNRYEVFASSSAKEHSVTLEEAHPLIQYVKTHGPLVRDFLADNQPDRFLLLDALKQLSAEVCLPLLSRGELVGILVLGHKKSDESYTQDEVEILTTLATTEAMAISSALVAAKAAQNEKLAIIGTLASAIDHEVSHPLGNIRMWAERFLMEWEQLKKMSRDQFEEKVYKFLKLVIEEIDRAVEVTRRFAGFAKPVREGKRELVEVEKVIREVFALLRQSSTESHIMLEEAFPPNLPPISVDPKQLSQILFNLVNNSIQSIGGRGGKVTAQANFNGRGRLAIDVIDTGSGIPPEQLKRLFTAYDTTKAEGKGTGLGLFLVKWMVEENGGAISVRSQVGVGTTFTVEFPAAPQNPIDGIQSA